MDFDKLVRECNVGMTGEVAPGMSNMAPQQLSPEEHHAESEDMVNSQLHSLASNVEKLKSLVANFDELDPWVQSKLTLAEDYITTITNYLEYEAGNHQQIGQMAPPTPVIAVVRPKLGAMMTKF